MTDPFWSQGRPCPAAPGTSRWADAVDPAALHGDTLLHTRFEARAREAPDAIALTCSKRRLTYGELDRLANRLAHHLCSLGVGPEARVGVAMTRSPELLVGLLGVLKAGGAYVPLDPAYPRERLALLQEDVSSEAGAGVLLTQRTLVAGLPLPSFGRVVLIDEAIERWGAVLADAMPPAGGARPGNLAYVIHTSGSTGRPKGVAIEHRSAAAFVRWAGAAFSPAELSGVFASTSISFDLSVFELFVPLSLGGRVVMGQDALELAKLEASREVTLLNTVPSAMAALLRLRAIPESVRTINLAGEPLTATLAGRLHALPRVERVLNLYGPSESTIYSTCAEIAKGACDEPGIGIPITGTRAHVLDGRLEPTAPGQSGELYLCGCGLARGYLGLPGSTAERFLPDPFSGVPGERMYRTGDLARQRPRGGLEFLGRVDHQVKIRGFRIELGEIEASLLASSGVREAAVLALETGPGQKVLVAFVVLEEGDADPGFPELKVHLRRKLPQHMLPAVYVSLAALPRMPNGKVDRRALARFSTDFKEAAV